MGQVLKFVNSSYFGFSREIMSVQQAFTLVGTRAITNFALWNAAFSVIPNPKFGPFDLKSLWRDSPRRALFARTLGREQGVTNAEDLFAGALLQDMAIPLLLKEFPAEYEELVQRRATEGRRLSGLEKELFGWDHADAAALLAERCNLPTKFVSLIAQHTHLSDLIKNGKSSHPAAGVALASLLPTCCDEAWDEQAEFVAAYFELTGQSNDDLAKFSPKSMKRPPSSHQCSNCRSQRQPLFGRCHRQGLYGVEQNHYGSRALKRWDMWPSRNGTKMIPE